jgi:hypothetical protein
MEASERTMSPKFSFPAMHQPAPAKAGDVFWCYLLHTQKVAGKVGMLRLFYLEIIIISVAY